LQQKGVPLPRNLVYSKKPQGQLIGLNFPVKEGDLVIIGVGGTGPGPRVGPGRVSNTWIGGLRPGWKGGKPSFGFGRAPGVKPGAGPGNPLFTGSLKGVKAENFPFGRGLKITGTLAVGIWRG